MILPLYTFKNNNDKAMKDNLIFLIVVLLAPLSSNGQMMGKVTYKSILESEKLKELESTLLFNEQESFFSVDMIADESKKNNEDIKLSDDEDTIQLEFNLTLKRPTRYEVYINREKKQILSQSSIFKNGSLKPCVVSEQIGSINWELTGDSKKIGSFRALKATTRFRGRNYSVWFTTEIPIPVGPWKFHGLPGLILEVQDEELGVQFLFSSIQFPFALTDQIKPPSEGEIISLSEYVSYNDSFQNEFIKLIRSKLPREASISNISVNKVIRSIEREYK